MMIKPDNKYRYPLSSMPPGHPLREQQVQAIDDDGPTGMWNLALRDRTSRKASFESVNIIASDGGGWEHVSASCQNRCPTWDEMCQIKDIFWEEEDCVVQYHPPASQYVNCHPNTLHLWRPITEGWVITNPAGEEDNETGAPWPLPMPPSIMVGPKDG